MPVLLKETEKGFADLGAFHQGFHRLCKEWGALPETGKDGDYIGAFTGAEGGFSKAHKKPAGWAGFFAVLNRINGRELPWYG